MKHLLLYTQKIKYCTYFLKIMIAIWFLDSFAVFFVSFWVFFCRFSMGHNSVLEFVFSQGCLSHFRSQAMSCCSLRSFTSPFFRRAWPKNPHSGTVQNQPEILVEQTVKHTVYKEHEVEFGYITLFIYYN